MAFQEAASKKPYDYGEGNWQVQAIFAAITKM
jgi:hypothetical protein